MGWKLFIDSVEMRAVGIPGCRNARQKCPYTVFIFLLDILFPFSFFSFFFLIVSSTIKVLVDLNK